MNGFLKKVFILFAVALLLFSCVGVKEHFPAVDGKVVPMHSSSLLAIVECDGYTVVDVADPWGGGTMQRYLLVSSVEELPANLPEGVLLRKIGRAHV